MPRPRQGGRRSWRRLRPIRRGPEARTSAQTSRSTRAGSPRRARGGRGRGWVRHSAPQAACTVASARGQPAPWASVPATRRPAIQGSGTASTRAARSVAPARSQAPCDARCGKGRPAHVSHAGHESRSATAQPTRIGCASLPTSRTRSCRVLVLSWFYLF